MTGQQPVFRKTRFVCISDTHNASPNGAFKLPSGDVLIHAGDLTNQGSYTELQKTIKWIEEADFEAKIVVAGMPSPISKGPVQQDAQETMMLLSTRTSMSSMAPTSTIRIHIPPSGVRNSWNSLPPFFG